MASTALNEQVDLPGVIELHLVHHDSSMGVLYHRAIRLPERWAMMQSGSDSLDALRFGANVMPLHRPVGGNCIVRGSFKYRIAYRYKIHCAMIKSFRHDGLARYFQTGSKAGSRPEHAKRLNGQLGRLDGATCPEDMNMPGWRFHRLLGELVGHYAVSVRGNWRLAFKFEGKDAVLVDYQDYH